MRSVYGAVTPGLARTSIVHFFPSARLEIGLGSTREQEFPFDVFPGPRFEAELINGNPCWPLDATRTRAYPTRPRSPPQSPTDRLKTLRPMRIEALWRESPLKSSECVSTCVHCTSPRGDFRGLGPSSRLDEVQVRCSQGSAA